MADPISVRHVMATSEMTERVAKAEATQQQAFGEEFAKEMSRQEALKHTRVARKDADDMIRDKESKNEKEEERKKKAQSEAEAEADEALQLEMEANHIIDVQV